jgi:hypothetical protein
MREGDIVRLKQPFRPMVNDVSTYRYGIVAGVVNESSSTQILVRLYNLETASIYTDSFDAEAIYSFSPEEIECRISL